MIQNIFPLQIFTNNLNISDKKNSSYLSYIQKKEYLKTRAGSLSSCTEDQNILNNKIFNELRSLILKQAKEYLNTLGHIFEDLQFSNSWATKTDPGGFSALHEHKNSYISGTYYMKESSYISLKNPHFDKWFFDPDINFSKDNTYTYETLNFEPKEKSIILFPSFLKHSVYINQQNKKRYSIAFNIIPKGNFGKITSKLNI